MERFLNINSIESFSTKDGEGTRCVVFLQGCHHKCVYCHNIEMQNSHGGERIKTTELVKKITRYKKYFGLDGGITLSGGEPLLQAKSLIPFIEELKRQKINVAIETSGVALDQNIREVLRLADHIILDLKFASEKEYIKYCGGTLAVPLRILQECQSQKKRVWVRIVVVPGINNSRHALRQYIKIIKRFETEKVELLPFHTLGFSKYEKLGIKNPLKRKKPMSLEKCRKLQNFLDFNLKS